MITKLNSTRMLKICPFCAGAPELVVLEDENAPMLEPIYFVQCKNCAARGSNSDTPKDAENFWDGVYLEQCTFDELQDHGKLKGAAREIAP